MAAYDPTPAVEAVHRGGSEPYVDIMAQMARIARMSDHSIANRALLEAALAILRQIH